LSVGSEPASALEGVIGVQSRRSFLMPGPPGPTRR
jgi:hypothetical protein